jgi:HEAT repeat protein
MLQSPVEEERLLGLRKLACSGAEPSLHLVLQALGDESWRVRKEAVEVYLSLPLAAEMAGEVIELLHAQENAGLRNAAAEILVRLGLPAVPMLLEEIACGDPDVRKFVLDIVGEIGEGVNAAALVRALDDVDENVRAAAAENLGKLKAAEAVPALLDTLERADLWFRFTILEALAQIGEPVSVARLLPLGRERLLRKALFDCFGRIGSPEAFPSLLEGLTDEMRNVREAAAIAVDLIAERFPEETSPQLTALSGTPGAAAVAGLLQSSDAAARLAAVHLLRRIADGRFAVRLLELFAADELREEAAAALIALGATAVCSLIELWPGADCRTRTCLAYVIGESHCLEGAEMLASGLAEAEVELRMVCARALGQLGQPISLVGLVAALRDPAEEVREAAAWALGRLGERRCAETVAALRPLLDGEDPELRMHGVSVLGQLDGAESDRLLAFALKDESPLVRRAAVRAFEGRSNGAELPALILALTDEDAEVRRLAAEALGTSGDRQAAQALELALTDEDLWVRASAVRALGKLAGANAVVQVSNSLGDPVGLVAIAALETLCQLDSALAYPALLQALEHSDEEVVITALQHLAVTGRREWLGDAAEALINHRHWEVRSTFVRTLASLEGADCCALLEGRLLVEGEDVVRQQIQELLTALRDVEG